jgi:hypothetical protein
MKEITAETVVRRHPDAAFRVIDGTAIIVMPRDAKMLTLSDVGTRVWQLLDEGNVGEIAKAITEEFDTTLKQALLDTISFLVALNDRGLVTTQKRDI